MYAIGTGRMWRINAVVSPLLVEQLSEGQTTLTQRFVEGLTYISLSISTKFHCSKQKRQRRHSTGPRQQVTNGQLATIVIMFSLPQIILQIIAFFVQPQRRYIMFNDDESIGRATCGSNAATIGEDIITYCFVLLALLILTLLFMAFSSRKLPSLFNETRVIYDSTFLSVILLLLGAAVIALTNTPIISPDVQYLVSFAVVISVTLNSTIRILLPKLNMVWKGDTVVVSKLVTDHHKSEREKRANRSKNNSGSVADSVTVSGVDYTQQHSLLQSSEVRSSLASFRSDISASGRDSLDTSDRIPGGHNIAGAKLNPKDSFFTDEPQNSSVDNNGRESPTQQDSADTDIETGTKDLHSQDEKKDKAPPERMMPKKKSSRSMVSFVKGTFTKEESKRDTKKKQGHKHASSRPHRIVVTEDETPSRRLVLRMLDLQSNLQAVNQKIMTGMVVSPEEWESLTELTAMLENTFTDEVEFEWEDNTEKQKRRLERMIPKSAGLDTKNKHNTVGTIFETQEEEPPEFHDVSDEQADDAKMPAVSVAPEDKEDKTGESAAVENVEEQKETSAGPVVSNEADEVVSGDGGASDKAGPEYFI